MSTDTDKDADLGFQPQTLREVFAFQLAQRLEDEEHLSRYLDLLTKTSMPLLMDVLELAKESTNTPLELRERFWTILKENKEWRKDE